MKIKVSNTEDRYNMALILVRNGYKVQIIKEKSTTSSLYTYYVEFE